MKIVCVSDTHTHHRRLNLPAGDVLIHAGDLTNTGHHEQTGAALQWLAEQPHNQKVLIAGNHDWCFLRQNQVMRKMCAERGLIYLQDSGTEIAGLRIWGSPFTPEFAGWAFMEERGPSMRKHWDLIPDGLDILITHGPPQGILGRTRGGDHAGCADLRGVVEQRKPRVHVFGHIHEASGVLPCGETRFINAARTVATVEFRGADVFVSMEENK